MPSAAGKRVGRVLAGCSKPEAGDKPGLHRSREIRIGDVKSNLGVSKAYLKSEHIGIRAHQNRNRDYASCRNSGIHLFHPFCPFHPESPFLEL